MIKHAKASLFNFNKKSAKQDPMAVIADFSHPKNVDHFHSLLPYRFFDPAIQIFHNQYSVKKFNKTSNKNGFGFGLKLAPLTGADFDLVKQLNDIFCQKLPTGEQYSYQFCLSGHRQLLHQIQNNEQIHAQRGGVYKNLAHIESQFALKGLLEGFPSGYGKHARFDLKDYEAFFFVHALENDKEKILRTKEELEIALSTAQLGFQGMDAADLMHYVGNIINHNPLQLTPTAHQHNPYDYLNKQVIDASTLVNKIGSKYIDVQFNTDISDKKHTTRIICLTLKKLPREFFAGQLPDYLASSTSMGLALRCPFLWSVNFQVEEKVKSELQAKRKIKSIGKLKHMKLERLLPFLDDELEDYLEIERGIEDDRYRLCNFSMDLILFSNPDDYKRDQAAALNLFRQGLEMHSAEYLQGQIFHSIFPFCYGLLSQDRQNSGTRHRVKSTNIANFIPIVGDYKGAYDTYKKSPYHGLRYGLLTQTAKNQIAYFSPFLMGTDSFNVVIAGAMGAGKSVLAQSMIRQIVAMGGYCWAIDKGFSYQNLCLTLGGKQIDATSLFLNPFSFLDIDKMLNDPDLASDPNIDVHAIFANSISMITELYYMMGKPDDNSVNPFEYKFLKECILIAYGKHKTKTCVDHVWAEIAKAVEKDHQENRHDQRKADWLMLLKDFKTDGINGRVFNQQSQLDPDVPFICIEMEGVPKDLKKAVMLALTIDIDNRIILSSKSQPKAFVCEEVSQTLSFESQALESKFSEGAATYRKKNAALITITQLVSEYFKTNLLSVIYEKAALKVIMSQDAKFAAFAKKDKDDPLFTDAEIQTIRRFRPSSEARFSSFLLQKYDGSSSEHRYFLDPYSKILTTTKAEEVATIRDYRKQGLALDEAIDRTVMEFYGDEMKALKAFSEKFNQQPNQGESDV